MRILLAISIVLLIGCTTIEQEYNDGSVIMYRANQMTLTVVGADGLPIKGASVSVGTAGDNVARTLIAEIGKTPLVTPANGVLTLTSNGMWGKDWWSSTECVTVSGKAYCETQGSGHPHYEEYLIVSAPTLGEFRQKYIDIVECRVAGPVCKTVLDADGTNRYLINYTVQLAR